MTDLLPTTLRLSSEIEIPTSRKVNADALLCAAVGRETFHSHARDRGARDFQGDMCTGSHGILDFALPAPFGIFNNHDIYKVLAPYRGEISAPGTLLHEAMAPGVDPDLDEILYDVARVRLHRALLKQPDRESAFRLLVETFEAMCGFNPGGLENPDHPLHDALQRKKRELREALECEWVDE